MLEKIQEMDRKIKALTFRRNVELCRLQKKCKHPELYVRECSWEPLGCYGSLAPQRVCLLCGYAEEGWGCGYWKLNYSQVAVIPRESLYKKRLRLMTQSQMNKKRYWQKKLLSNKGKQIEKV